ncbi:MULTISPECIES: hypothetical protein [Clostridium]|uniref:hypothetical protein n=1 Tax=Clostridium TaxID=1485 RepID=UPI00019AFE2A|nr:MULTISPECIES: hypothetical protein [Clostridium]EEH96764.1 hypothetical protein CSBG_00390 [Clostridium sp. 7_2_43FAA]MBU6134296.1 hypothetical protein [Clostridium tertium]MDB1934434.1 hypothetical protein [Clostridium tertium]MDB1935935.1 hypothetical protein [Clostridium tertium]MDB1953761.1 hypothetical protein [Clostridium tertium]
MNKKIEKLINIYDPLDLIDEIDNINKDLLKEYNAREKILIEYEKLNIKYEELKKKYEILDRKYNNLKQSKLGKVTIKYWNTKKRLFKK